MPPLPCRSVRPALGLACFVLWTSLALPARAGGGPENVLLVVNPQSPASMTIANHYAALRQIPAFNIVYLSWDPKAETTDVETFRRKILMPLLEIAGITQPNRQIDYIVYSSDFPWAVKLDRDVARFAKELAGGGSSESAKPRPWPSHLTPVGSLNGMTYLWQPVLAGNSGYFEQHCNCYTRTSAPEQKDSPSLGFASTMYFGPRGEVLPSDGRCYMLSTMLGVTSGRGNSIDEVLAYLKRSAGADGTRPRGTIYFVQNSDVRSRVRHGEFPAAVRMLKALGVEAEIVEGIMPMNKDDVQGAMLGTASFHWSASKSTILPGAICEHFTSFGGVMSAGAGQTPLSELLRYGAAGASGTVTEPYALADKFPSPMIHAHYARGCTLAEAFYQSVYNPYQLLIVGDPLCRPWADIPEVSVEGIEPGATVQGPVRLRPTAQLRLPRAEIECFELFIDGMRVERCLPGGVLEFKSAPMADGYHELRVVAVEKGLLRTQGRAIIPIMTANNGLAIEVSGVPRKPLPFDATLTLVVKAPGCAGILIGQGKRMVGQSQGEHVRFELKAASLGAGPVRLQAIGLGTKGPKSNVLSRPIELTVESPPPPPKVAPPPKTVPSQQAPPKSKPEPKAKPKSIATEIQA